MLIKKMLRELKKHFGQFFSIFMLTYLAAAMLTGIQGEVESVVSARNKYEAETNLADGWIYGENFTEENVQKVSRINNIKDAERRCYIKAKDRNDCNVYTYFEEDVNVSRPYTLEGEEFNPDDKDGIWLCSRFAKEHDINVGDTYQIEDGSDKYSFKVRGLVWSPEYEYYKDDIDTQPDYKKNGYAFTSVKVLPEDKALFNQIAFTADKADGADERFNTVSIENDISAALDGNYSTLLGRDGLLNITMLDDEIAQHKGMAIVMPAFFILIAMLTTITSMKRIVDRQRTQIGTLKAIGMKKSKIYMHYLSYGFFPSFIGSLIGVIFGPRTLAPSLAVAKYFLDTSTEYMLPQFDIVYPLYFFAIGLAITIICTLAAWFATRSILQIVPAEALKPAQPKSSKAVFLEKFKFWKKLNFSSRYNLRDISKNKSRTILGLAGTTLCMALLLMGLGSKDNFKNAVYDLYIQGLMDNGNMITINQNVPIEECEELRDEVNGELIMSDNIEIKVPGNEDKLNYHINVYEDGRIAQGLDDNFKPVKIGYDDFTLTKKAADKLNVKAGDTVEWHIYGSTEWTSSTVTMITRAPFEQGVTAGRGLIEKSGYKFTPTRLLTKDDIPLDVSNNKNVNSVMISSEADQEFGDPLSLVDMVMGFSITFALFLAVIVLYCLGLLTFEERLKEMAILKVLGLSTKKLKNFMLQQNLMISGSGVILGIPLGIAMINLLTASLGDSMDIPGRCDIKYIVLSAVITVVISAAVNFLFSGRIKNMNMVEETKSAE